MNPEQPCTDSETAVQQTLVLIRHTGWTRPRPTAAQPAATVSVWVDPRYKALAAAWEAVQPPPETVGFLYSRA